MEIEVRPYKDSDYEALVSVYKKSKEFAFDPETDARERIAEKIRRDPESILVMMYGEELWGSVSIIEDGRIAILFRWVAATKEINNEQVLEGLLSKAQNILRKKGYREVHCMAPSQNAESSILRTGMGFNAGDQYSWFWKKL